MPKLLFLHAAIAGALPSRIGLPLATPCFGPPAGDGRLHELKHDGHRLIAILDGHGGLRLISRNGFDRTAAFRAPFDPVLARIRRAMGIDGEIAVPDDRGVTHIDDLHGGRGRPTRSPRPRRGARAR